VYVRPRCRQVQEGANHAPILLLVHKLIVLIIIQIHRGGHGHQKRLGLAHVKLLKDVLDVFSLVNKCIVLGLLDFQPKEEGELFNHAHLKLPAHSN
jgi:hypothetical protein